MAEARDTLSDLRRDLKRALRLMADKRPEYELAREYGEGTRAEIAGSRVARRIIEQSEAAPISFAHIPVEVIAEKVELASITAPEAQAAAALATWMDVNDIEDEASDWIHKACMFGDYYVILDPQEEDDDGRAIVESSRTLGSSPLDTIVIYDRRTLRVPEFGLHVWETGSGDEKETHAVLYYDDACVRLITRRGESGNAADNFVLDYPASGEPEDAYLFHDGERMLIHHLPIGGKPYGIPVHRKAWGPQDALTKISANLLVDVDSKGLPSRWALLDPNAETDDDLDDDFGTDGPTTSPAKSDGLTTPTSGRVRAVPGAISMLRGVRQVGTFETGSSDDFLKSLDWYVRAMAVATGIPLFEFDLNGEQPSGEARRRAEGRANRKASKVKRAAERFLGNVADTVLALSGIEGTVAVTFNPSETSTDKDGLELVSIKVKAGVPIRQALREAGYTEELVREWYPDGEPAISPEVLTLLATALAQLGSAKTLGVITDDELAAMLPEILTGARDEGIVAPVEEVDPAAPLPLVTNPASELKAKFEALGIAIRAGVDQEEAAATLGLEGLSFPNLPTTIRVPERETVGLEDV